MKYFLAVLLCVTLLALTEARAFHGRRHGQRQDQPDRSQNVDVRRSQTVNGGPAQLKGDPNPEVQEDHNLMNITELEGVNNSTELDQEVDGLNNSTEVDQAGGSSNSIESDHDRDGHHSKGRGRKDKNSEEDDESDENSSEEDKAKHEMDERREDEKNGRKMDRGDDRSLGKGGNRHGLRGGRRENRRY